MYPNTIEGVLHNKTTPLLLASSNTISISTKETIEILLRHGACVDVQDDRGCTPLMVSAFNCEKELVRILLKYNPNINLSDKKGCTALFYSILMDNSELNIETIKLLLDNGADVNFRDKMGSTVLMCIDYRIFPIKTLKLILERGGNVNLQNSNGETTLMLAINYLPIKNILIEIIMKHEADIWIENKDGDNAITKAFKESQCE